MYNAIFIMLYKQATKISTMYTPKSLQLLLLRSYCNVVRLVFAEWPDGLLRWVEHSVVFYIRILNCMPTVNTPHVDVSVRQSVWEFMMFPIDSDVEVIRSSLYAHCDKIARTTNARFVKSDFTSPCTIAP